MIPYTGVEFDLTWGAEVQLALNCKGKLLGKLTKESCAEPKGTR